MKHTARIPFHGWTGLALAMIAMWHGPGISLAQEAATEPMALAEVVISARKRVETLQEAPLAVTALSADQIEARGIRSLEDLSAFTPGFYFKSVGSFEGRTTSDLRFRGMDVNTSTPWLQLGSVFVDGVYISGGVQNIGFENVERVEVIKGPQSAMFGRSTFGGAVNFVTADPSDELEGRLSASVGQDDDREFQAWLSSPIIADKLGGRLSARYFEKGGQYTNPTDGLALGAQETISVSGTLVATPAEFMTAKLVLFYARDSDSLAPLMLVRNSAANCGPFFVGGRRTFCGELPPYFGGVDADLRQFLAGITQTDIGIRMDQSGLEREARRASLDLEFDLGPVVLASVTGVSDEALGVARDGDLIPNFAFFHLWQGRDTQDLQQELRLASDGDSPISWLVGANYYDYEYRADTVSPPTVLLQSDVTFIETTGIFGSIGWRPSEKYEFTFEGRYQEDSIDQGGPLKGDFSNFLPRVTARYNPVDSTTLYLSASKGNKPGGFNANVARRPATEQAILASEYGIGIAIGEENLWNYEIGAKQRFAGGQGYGNVALYYMQWTDQQTRRTIVDPRIFGGVPFGGFVNAGESELYGVELESGWRVNDYWEVTGAYAYAHSAYVEFSSTLYQQVYGTADASGADLPNNPGHTGSLSNTLRWPLGEKWSGIAQLDLLYEGSRYTDEVNLATYGERWRVNAQIGLQRGDLSMTLYARNLTNDSTVPSARQFSDLQLGGFAWEVLMPEQRTYGLRFDYSRRAR